MSFLDEIRMRRVFPFRSAVHRSLRDAMVTPSAEWSYAQARLVLRYCDAVRPVFGKAGRLWSTAQAVVRQMEDQSILRATARGGSVDELKNDALRRAASLFGPDASLEVVSCRDIATSAGGGFMASVVVRADPATVKR